MGFRIIEDVVSGDYVFEALGDTIEELFRSCAEACFNATTDLSKVDNSAEFAFSLKAENVNELLYAFLAELIYLKDTEKVFLSKFEIVVDYNHTALKAVAWGERIDYNKHEIKTDVKAVTYHKLEVKKENGPFEVRVILDL